MQIRFFCKKKYARVVANFAKRAELSLAEALNFFMPHALMI